MTATATAIAGLWQKHRGSVLAQVDLLERFAAGDERLREEARREAHKVAGSVGTYGFHAASARAKDIETAVAAGRCATGLAGAVASLRSELEIDPWRDAPAAPAVAEDRSPLLLIVDDDDALAERLAVDARIRGIRAETAGTPAAAAAAIARRTPDLVLLDLAFPGGLDAAYDLLSDLTARTPAVPVIVLTSSDDLADRVEVARRGGHGFLRKSLGPRQVVDAVSEFLERTRATTTTILALDDDPAVLDAAAALLAPHGIELVALHEPPRFWDVLNEVAPDLVMLDVDMPGLSGVDVCQVLRHDARWARVPVLFLTARSDAATVARLFAAGADDYVSKPIVGPELIGRIGNRVERTRLYRAAAETDPLTGIANRRAAQEALGQLLKLAGRYEQPLSVALLDIDRFKAVNDDHGHAAGDAVLVRLAQLLRGSFRGEDVVARWGGEEFLVAMYGMSRADAVRRLTHELERFAAQEFRADGRSFASTFSAGVAELRRDGTALAPLLKAADDALYAAKEGGRAIVLPAGG